MRLYLTVVCLCLSAALGSRAWCAETWSARSGQFSVTWTATSISAGRTGEAATFSAQDFAHAGFDLALAQLKLRHGQELTIRHKIGVVALAGPLLSILDHASMETIPSAHGSEETRLWTIDLRRSGPMGFDAEEPFRVAHGATGRFVALSELFDPAVIHRSLAGDARIRRVVPQYTSSLDELVGLLANRGGAVPGFCLAIPADLLTHFAITGRRAKTVTVLLQLSSGGSCGPQGTQVQLALPAGKRFTAVVRPWVGSPALPPPGMQPVNIMLSADLRKQ